MEYIDKGNKKFSKLLSVMGLTHQLTRNLFTITGLGHVSRSSNSAGLGQAVDHGVG